MGLFDVFKKRDNKDKQNASQDGAKPLSMLKATVRYNQSGLIGEICGPITGFGGLRAKRISKIDGKLVVWEAKCVDLTLEDSDIGGAKVWGLNIPSTVGSDGVTYGSYIDVMIKGEINRIRIPVAKIPGPIENRLQVMTAFNNGRFPFRTSPLPTAGTVPVVSGWIKDPSRPNITDEHFGDPLCPEGYAPLIVGYIGIKPLRVASQYCGLVLPRELWNPPTYIMEKFIKFSSI